MYLIGLLFAASLATSSSTAAAPPISGVAQVVDGDSLRVGSTEVRLFGIDAPEADQTCRRDGSTSQCGSEATEQVAKLVAGKRVFCASMGVDQYKRLLGRCVVGASDVNETMVALGHAVAYRRYSTDYVPAEERAKAQRRGLWAGTFQAPDKYRVAGTARVKARSRNPARAASAGDWAGRAKANCNIKGNRNRKGQWIYHLPGMPYYDRTLPEEIFCTEQEARAAGYRRAIVR